MFIFLSMILFFFFDSPVHHDISDISDEHIQIISYKKTKKELEKLKKRCLFRSVLYVLCWKHEISTIAANTS